MRSDVNSLSAQPKTSRTFATKIGHTDLQRALYRMPYRYWRSDVALGLLAIAALLGGYFVPLVLSGSDVMRSKDENARPRFATANQDGGFLQSSVPGLSKVRPQSVYKQLSCDKPETQKQYELCQQWRAAEAAEEQACVARRQFWVGGP
jgi:hypothetical protein